MKQIRRIGLIIPEVADQLDFELVSGVFDQAKHLGCDVIIYTGVFNSLQEYQPDQVTNGLENIYSLFCKQDLDGVLFAAERFHNAALVQRVFDFMSQTDLPCLTLGCPHPSYPNLNAEQYDSAYLITKHLIDVHHCKNLFCIAGVPDHEASGIRLQGVLDAAADAGLEIGEKGIFYGWYWKEVPRQVAVDIACEKLERPDGIVCLSDLMAITLTDTLKEYGIRVPEDIAVIGYDGIWNTVVHDPQITTVTGRDRQFGIQAVCRLYEIITGEQCEELPSAQCLRLGMSCGCQFHAPEVRDDILFSLEHYVASRLSRYFDKNNFIISNFAETLTHAASLGELIMRIDCVGHILRGWKWIDLCLCEDWKISFDHPDAYRQQGFSDTMYLALAKRYGGNRPCQYSFPTAQISPSFDEPHPPTLAVVTSLHCNGQIFGYCLTGYDSAEALDLGEWYLRWCDAVSNGLHLLQKRLYAAHVHEQSELRSTTDPTTGMLNRRGCMEALPTVQTEGTTLLLISWVRLSEEKVYDTPVILSRAIPEMEQIVLRARLSESCLGILLRTETAEQLQEMSAQILAALEEALQALPVSNARPALLHQTYPVSGSDPEALEQFLQQSLTAFRQKRDSESVHFATQKQLLYKLRRDILAQPQLNWEVADISLRLGISKTQLKRLYKALFSVSIREDVLRARIERAQQLLLHTKMPVRTVAFQCGFDSEESFQKQFREKTGVAPEGMREQK